VIPPSLLPPAEPPSPVSPLLGGMLAHLHATGSNVVAAKLRASSSGHSANGRHSGGGGGGGDSVSGEPAGDSLSRLTAAIAAGQHEPSSSPLSPIIASPLASPRSGEGGDGGSGDAGGGSDGTIGGLTGGTSAASARGAERWLERPWSGDDAVAATRLWAAAAVRVDLGGGAVQRLAAQVVAPLEEQATASEAALRGQRPRAKPAAAAAAGGGAFATASGAALAETVAMDDGGVGRAEHVAASAAKLHALCEGIVEAIAARLPPTAAAACGMRGSGGGGRGTGTERASPAVVGGGSGAGRGGKRQRASGGLMAMLARADEQGEHRQEMAT